MTKTQMVREIRRRVRERQGSVPGRLLPAWLVALTTKRYELVCTLDRLGYRTTPEMWGTGVPARRDHWFVVALTNVVYLAFWTVSAVLFGLVWGVTKINRDNALWTAVVVVLTIALVALLLVLLGGV